MTNKFMVVVRNWDNTLTYSHSEPSYSEACISIPPVDIDDRDYNIICPDGFVIPKTKVGLVEPGDLPF
jgi:hypothetical protein